MEKLMKRITSIVQEMLDSGVERFDASYDGCNIEFRAQNYRGNTSLEVTLIKEGAAEDGDV